METTISKQARFDTRLPKAQKQLFEKASVIGGYRSLSDFIVQAAQEKATEIIKEREQIIASERDSAIFFNEIIKSKKPNKSLRRAVDKYKSQISE